jgi:hypothetical protein
VLHRINPEQDIRRFYNPAIDSTVAEKESFVMVSLLSRS